jgi:hypothetical protein
MPSFPLLDIAIGLMFVYLLLSLICSALNEGLESILRNRANDLEAAIRSLLGDNSWSWWRSFLPWVNSLATKSAKPADPAKPADAPKASETPVQQFYRHPLIRNLFRKEERLPTYIPARNFALAIMDMASSDGRLIRGATDPTDKPAPTDLTALAKAVQDGGLPDNLKKSVTALLQAANGDAQQARINIENWFNSSMDRVSGWYKSRTQKILFSIGVVVTILVNADSIAIFRNLSHSKNLQDIVAAAQSATAQKSPDDIDAMKQLKGLDIGIGWASETEQHGDLDGGQLPPRLDGAGCTKEMKPCQDPIGWTWYLLYLHALGWLITAAAISLGAPFWFDTLNRFMVVRSTVKPKEKSPDEGSKDPKPGA